MNRVKQKQWIPAFAGMTFEALLASKSSSSAGNEGRC
jgi:hypothetical protein